MFVFPKTLISKKEYSGTPGEIRDTSVCYADDVWLEGLSFEDYLETASSLIKKVAPFGEAKEIISILARMHSHLVEIEAERKPDRHQKNLMGLLMMGMDPFTVAELLPDIFTAEVSSRSPDYPDEPLSNSVWLFPHSPSIWVIEWRSAGGQRHIRRLSRQTLKKALAACSIVVGPGVRAFRLGYTRFGAWARCPISLAKLENTNEAIRAK